MVRRKPDNKKLPSTLEMEAYLKKAHQFRRDTIAFSELWPSISGARYATDAITRTIDDMAMTLTGDRERFWNPKHSTPKC